MENQLTNLQTNYCDNISNVPKKKLEEIEKMIEENTKLFEDHEKNIEENKKILEAHEKKLEKTEKMLEDHEKIIEENKKMLEDHEKNIEESKKMLEVHEKNIEESKKMLENHEKNIEETKKFLEDHEKNIEINAKMLEESKKRINALFNRINNNSYTFSIKENSNELIEELEIDEKFTHDIEIEKNKCIICLNNYKIRDKISYLHCLHLFHSGCIKEWLKRSNKCPLCKNEAN